MAKLNGDIKKLRRGEKCGVAATVFCGAVLIYFAVCFTVARVRALETLQLVTLITAPILLIAGAAAAAYCNLKFGGALDKAVKKYVLDVCLENAALMHPERNSLSFYITLEDCAASMQVNGYKEKIEFDFSDFGKLTLSGKVGVLTAIENRLTVTFCKLYERGGTYTDVNFSERTGTRRKSGKVIPIISGGKPDKNAYKIYLKNK